MDDSFQARANPGHTLSSSIFQLALLLDISQFLNNFQHNTIPALTSHALVFTAVIPIFLYTPIISNTISYWVFCTLYTFSMPY
ncbi:hypothetical protein EYC80_002479 [Monilinia laxa]|uniref:Uncharacterized protein n=1 Tax=Monilinia laxa TaxID=61186 RepID=A0A5N6K435_MONLA|nr:hypothetical protein EYC80_002479 [Monilinia laxa]